MQRINSFAGVTWLDDQLTNEKLRIVKNIDCMLMHVHEVYVTWGQVFVIAYLRALMSPFTRFFEMYRVHCQSCGKNDLIFIKITTPFIKLQGFSSLSPILVAF